MYGRSGAAVSYPACPAIAEIYAPAAARPAAILWSPERSQGVFDAFVHVLHGRDRHNRRLSGMAAFLSFSSTLLHASCLRDIPYPTPLTVTAIIQRPGTNQDYQVS